MYEQEIRRLIFHYLSLERRHHVSWPYGEHPIQFQPPRTSKEAVRYGFHHILFILCHYLKPFRIIYPDIGIIPHIISSVREGSGLDLLITLFDISMLGFLCFTWFEFYKNKHNMLWWPHVKYCLALTIKWYHTDSIGASSIWLRSFEVSDEYT